MAEIFSNTIKVLISFFITLLLNRLLSVFRKRQLYLSCWNYLDNTSLSDSGCTINASIYNNGKDKEKNVIIYMPMGFKCSAISGNQEYVNEDGVIKIDRILSGKKVSLVILIEGCQKLDKKTKPKIKSEDADGKVYLTNDIVPPSAGYLTFISAVMITIIAGFSYLFSTGIDPIEKSQNAYNYMFNNKYYALGFSLDPTESKILTKRYDISNGDYPIELIDAKRSDGLIQYKFRVINKYSNPLIVNARYEINDSKSFWREITEVNNSLDKGSIKERELKVFGKYHVDTGDEYTNNIFQAYDTKVIVAANSLGYLILSRKDYPYISLDDMNVSFELKIPNSNNQYQDLDVRFYSYKNILSNKLFDK